MTLLSMQYVTEGEIFSVLYTVVYITCCLHVTAPGLCDMHSIDSLYTLCQC